MKKIASIIDNCKKCPSCLRFNPPQHVMGQAFICGQASNLLGIGQTIESIAIPKWCPLETYSEAEKSEAQPDAPSTTPSTIILPGLPHLEWMTENLTGFGGTEIDGRTYYTYDEAVEAVKQLGNGWRVPTRGEMVDLCDLGSEWQEEGPHGLPGRLFGGGLFLEAAGYRYRDTGALAGGGLLRPFVVFVPFWQRELSCRVPLFHSHYRGAVSRRRACFRFSRALRQECQVSERQRDERINVSAGARDSVPA